MNTASRMESTCREGRQLDVLMSNNANWPSAGGEGVQLVAVSVIFQLCSDLQVSTEVSRALLGKKTDQEQNSIM